MLTQYQQNQVLIISISDNTRANYLFDTEHTIEVFGFLMMEFMDDMQDIEDLRNIIYKNYNG